MKRLLVMACVAAATVAAALPSSGAPVTAGAVGGGAASFHLYFYSTSSISRLTLDGDFPTGGAAFAGHVESGYADLVPGCCGGDATFQGLDLTGSSTVGGHRLSGTCAGTMSEPDPLGEPGDPVLRLTCTTSVDGGTAHASHLTVVASWDGGGDPQSHGEDFSYTGTYAG